MEVVDVRSSSGDLSSAPNSDVEGPYPTLHIGPNTTASSTHTNTNNHNLLHTSSAFDVLGSKPTVSNVTGLPKIRKPRAKKIKDSDATTAPTEKKPRKPRAAPGTSAAARKKQKTEHADASVMLQNIPPTIQPPISRVTDSGPPVSTLVPKPEVAKYSQNGFSSTSTPMQISSPYIAPAPLPVATKPRAMFDPVRGMTTERSHDPIVPVQTPLSTPPRPMHHSITSPSLNSIMNPPENNVTNSRPSTSSRSGYDIPPLTSIINIPTAETAMDLDVSTQQEKKATSEAPVPKAATKPRAKEQPPPLPAGSGLLSSSLFGGDSGVDSKDADSEKGPNIVLHIDLKNPNNKVINFARLAEEKYGFAALYPRQAAQKERLARVAAAGAALERSASATKNGTSAEGSVDDDLSVDVDIDRDSDNDGDIAMSGVNGSGEAVNSGTDGAMGRKRKKRKDEYDAEDPFVDDSELLWEAQAAASKDGFFVYCGPLVPEGEKPTVERADGTIKRGRGRGRGGGPGSRGGRGAAAAARAAGESSGRGGGPGSRGGGITRKPRITKAERQQRELEKNQREQMAVLAAKPTTVAS